MSSRPLTTAFYILCWTFVALFLVWPIVQILQDGFRTPTGMTTFYLFEVFTNPLYREGLRNAFGMGVFSTIGAFLLALPLAWIADRYQFTGRTLLLPLVLMPLILPPFVGAIGVQQLLGHQGVINAILVSSGLVAPERTVDWLVHGRFWGIVGLNALSLYPIIYLNALAALGNIDPAMEEAAEDLGAGTWTRFRTITLPLMRPGLFAGGTLVFIWSFTELGVPLIFDYNRITSVQIFNGLKDIGGNPLPFALVTVLLIVSALAYAIGKGLFGRQNDNLATKAGQIRSLRTLSRRGQLLCTLIVGSVTLLALLPHVAVVLFSLSSDWYASVLPADWTMRNYSLALSNPITVPSIGNSLLYSSFATLLCAILGVAIAYLTVRTRLPGRHILDTAAMLPLAVPGIVMAFGYIAMTREGRLFAFLDPVDNPTVLLIIAYAVRKLPFMVRAAHAGFQQINIAYEEAARNLGASTFRVLKRITLPLLVANLIGGAIIVFSGSMLEVSDSLILAQKQQFYPITKAIFELMTYLGDGPYLAAALGVWAMVFLAVTLFAATTLLGRKLGAVFRL